MRSPEEQLAFMRGVVLSRLRIILLSRTVGPRVLTDLRYRQNQLDKYKKKRRLEKQGLTLTQYANHTSSAKRRILGTRTHGYCMICRKRCPRNVLTIDHIKKVAEGGANDKTNFQLICRPCHDIKDGIVKQPRT